MESRSSAEARTKNLMKHDLTRRSFLQRTTLAAGVLSAAPFNILTAANAGDKVRCVQIGCGSRGMSHISAILKENIVGLVDVEDARHAVVKRALKDKNYDAGKVKEYADYRKMFDEIGKDIDAVFIASPNHQHALPALIAMQLGKNVYCEKPVCHNIGEARNLRAMAAKTKVATQMGNQGHCEDGYRKLCEYIWSGTIGKVTETHSWTNRSNGGIGPRPPQKPVPSGMHWDEWIGPAPYREFHDDLHPHSWHGWYDFGNGSIGNMGCHVLDGVYWALKVEHPTSIEVEQIRGGSAERCPTGSRLRWDIPARGDMPAFKAYWYEGLNEAASGTSEGVLRAVKGADRNFPKQLLDLIKKYPDEELDSGDSGTIYIGEKGVIFTGTYGDRMHIVPFETIMKPRHRPSCCPARRGFLWIFWMRSARAKLKQLRLLITVRGSLNSRCWPILPCMPASAKKSCGMAPA